MVYKVVFIRHGNSEWNKANKFCGWTDIDLDESGINEAQFAAKILKENKFKFDIAFTSVLKRSIRTNWIILDTMNQLSIPVYRSWRLNERHYGALQGLNKLETVEKYGKEQVMQWRRSYDIPPPELSDDDFRRLNIDPIYKSVPKSALPKCESLKLCMERVIPYWIDFIAPQVLLGNNVVVCTHGNTIRSLIKYFDNLSENEILEVNIPTGVPLVYEFDEDLNPVKHYFLMEEEELQKKIESVKNQTKK